MLNSYLRPETLEGDNKYHCEKCLSLQDAIKTIDIVDSPNHLKCILMRYVGIFRAL
jgi:ubiquitin carboxyl-terminal hydrolase 35/38